MFNINPLSPIILITTDKVRYKNNKIADGDGRLNLDLLLEYNKIQLSYTKIRTRTTTTQQDRIQCQAPGISPFASRLGREESREPIFIDALEGGEYSADSLRLEVEYGEGGNRSEGEFSYAVSRGRVCGERDER